MRRRGWAVHAWAIGVRGGFRCAKRERRECGAPQRPLGRRLVMSIGRDEALRMLERIEALRRSIARYRRYLEEGVSRKLAAAYLQAIDEAEAEIASVERRMMVP